MSNLDLLIDIRGEYRPTPCLDGLNHYDPHRCDIGPCKGRIGPACDKRRKDYAPRWCSKCHVEKDVSEFGGANGRINRNCRLCLTKNSVYRVKRRMGL